MLLHNPKKLAVLCFFLVLLGSIFYQCQFQQQAQPQPNEYIGSATCKSCHAEAYQEWETSHHFHAMEVPSPASVRADFSGVSYAADGDSSYFYQMNNDYYVNYTSNLGETDTFQIAYTFGWEPLQQFLVKTEKGRLQTLRASWDAEQEKWFHQYAGDTIAPETYLHWTGQSMTWNTMCADCHSTNVQKQYNPQADSFHTTYSEATVGCEGCHGPGSAHIAAVQNGEVNSTQNLRLTTSLIQKEQVNQCASCHMRRSVMGDSHMLGDFWDVYLPQTISNTHYHADGQILEEDYVWGSFVQSRMYHEGVQCTDCHNPHTNALKFEGNKLCLQCHETSYDTPAHHHHELATASAECINCHMTGKHYMGNDYRRDHSFRIPRPDLSIDTEIPNACNGCHTDKSAQWAADAARQWYGAPRQNYADVLVKRNPNELLQALAEDTVPVIAKATALEYFVQNPSRDLLALISKTVKNKEPLLRIQALEALNNAPKELRKQHGIPALSDSLQPVRNLAAQLTADLSPNELTKEQYPVWQQAQLEYQKRLNYQADFREGRMAAAQYDARRGQWDVAIAQYQQALKFDPDYVEAYTGWATALAKQGNPKASYALLVPVARKYPEQVRLQFLTGITAYELGYMVEAVHYLEQAVALSDYYPQYVQNLALLYLETNAMEQAHQLVQVARQQHPQSQQLMELSTYLDRVGSNI